MTTHSDRPSVPEDTTPAREADALSPAGDTGPAESESGAAGSSDEARQHLVNVREAIRYRKRAQAAEQQLDELKGRLQDTQAELAQMRQTLGKLERRQQIDGMLADAEAVDVEVARLLTEAAVQTMAEPDVKLAVEDLRRHKPYLFRRGAATASSMPARSREPVGVAKEQAAQQAIASGDRRDLLRYLRLRRKK